MQNRKPGKTIAMIFARPNHIPAFVLKKLQLLSALLTERKREFEAFARQMVNKAFRRTVLELAQVCNQYAHEIIAQLETMTGQVIIADECEHPEDITLLCATADILHSCQLSEQKIVAVYRSLLNEPLLDDNLRNLLRNQCQGFACAYTQIELLNSALSYN